MIKQLFVSLINIIVILVITGCASAVRVDGPYEGRIIDTDSGQAIEGVVVLGVWNSVIVTPGGGTHNFHDAQETVTDINGDFKIKGLGLEVMGNIAPMDVVIFKSGYEYFGCAPWVALRNRGWKGNEESYDPVKNVKTSKPVFDPKQRVKWEGSKALIPLKNLSMAERKKQGSPDFSSQIPGDKMKLMLDEINKDRAERGLGPFRLRGGK